MQVFRVEGGARLSGEVQLCAAKNAVLPILAASVMTEETITLLDTPNIVDVENMLGILQAMGCSVQRSERCMEVSARDIREDSLPTKLAKLLRSSV
ncbi:MAG: UDP-N-acetylglucosamine 1-carboxyvinyltransferase, partial [Clostridia bacterium]